jgi:hypothetical protein
VTHAVGTGLRHVRIAAGESGACFAQLDRFGTQTDETESRRASELQDALVTLFAAAEHPGGTAPRIAALTANAQAGDRAICIEAGMLGLSQQAHQAGGTRHGARAGGPAGSVIGLRAPRTHVSSVLMTYRAPDEDEARAILDAMDAAEEGLGPGRGQLVFAIDKQDGTQAVGYLVSITEPPGGFTLGENDKSHTVMQYADVARITILGYD